MPSRGAHAALWGALALGLGLVPVGCGILVSEEPTGFVGGGPGGGRPRDGGEPQTDAELEDARKHDAETGKTVDSGEPDAVSVDAEATTDAGDGESLEGSDGGADAGVRPTRVIVEASVEWEVAKGYQCPGIAVFSISPALLGPGQPAYLDVVTAGPPAVVEWTASPARGGVFSSATSLTPTFVCTGPGPVTVTATADLADGGTCVGVHFTSISGTIDCRVK
jgi:hypothetical protein